MRNTVNRILIWLLNAALFYYLAIVLASIGGFLLKGVELTLLAEIIIVVGVLGLSIFLTVKIIRKFQARLNTLSFWHRLLLTICALLSLAATLPLIIKALPNRM